MKVYILGIAGTFMAGCAIIARQLGAQVSGCDRNVYPPMSDQLAAAGIEYQEGFDLVHAQAAQADCYIIGNAISRGNPILEWILDANAPYMSAPEWLYQQCLRTKHVVAVSGTHGKTTTTALLLHILNQCGYNPSYLIGGALADDVPCATLTESEYFVIEADEYDTAFFDKRSKFIHYHPSTLIINALEFDHADIFARYADVERTFHHLVRTLPRRATIIHHSHARVKKLLSLGCYSQQASCGKHKHATLQLLKSRTQPASGSQNLTIAYEGSADAQPVQCQLPLLGTHNQENALAALLAALTVGAPLAQAAASLATFNGIKRRQEVLCRYRGVTFIEDFGHHPTAIARTIAALRPTASRRLIVVVDPRSNTMKKGTMKNRLLRVMEKADHAILYHHEQLSWCVDSVPKTIIALKTVDEIVAHLGDTVAVGDVVVLFSNGSFDGLQSTIVNRFHD